MVSSDINLDFFSDLVIDPKALYNFVLTGKQDIGRYGTIKRHPLHVKLE
jgi:hypothetical protein